MPRSTSVRVVVGTFAAVGCVGLTSVGFWPHMRPAKEADAFRPRVRADSFSKKSFAGISGRDA